VSASVLLLVVVLLVVVDDLHLPVAAVAATSLPARTTDVTVTVTMIAETVPIALAVQMIGELFCNLWHLTSADQLEQ